MKNLYILSPLCIGAGCGGISLGLSQVRTLSSLRSVVAVLNPSFITGFAYGESTFSVNATKSDSRKTGSQVQLRFTLTLHSHPQPEHLPPRRGGRRRGFRGSDALLLGNIQKSLGCGSLGPLFWFFFGLRPELPFFSVLPFPPAAPPSGCEATGWGGRRAAKASPLQSKGGRWMHPPLLRWGDAAGWLEGGEGGGGGKQSLGRAPEGKKTNQIYRVWETCRLSYCN
nr:hypothetical protein [Morchella crassipes]